MLFRPMGICLFVFVTQFVTSCSGVTPIGQDWRNARGPRGLEVPKPDATFLYISIFQVLGIGHLLYSQLIFVNVRQALVTFDHVGWLHCRLACKSTFLYYSCFCVFTVIYESDNVSMIKADFTSHLYLMVISRRSRL